MLVAGSIQSPSGFSPFLKRPFKEIKRLTLLFYNEEEETRSFVREIVPTWLWANPIFIKLNWIISLRHAFHFPRKDGYILGDSCEIGKHWSPVRVYWKIGLWKGWIKAKTTRERNVLYCLVFLPLWKYR